MQLRENILGGVNGLLPSGLSVGDTLRIDVVVNNGNNSQLSQTWAYTDMVSCTFYAGGSYSAEVDPQLGSDQSTNGSFTTDGAGNLTGLPDDWHQGYGAMGGSQLDSNGTEIQSWFLNGANSILYLQNGTGIGTLIQGIIDLSKWEIV